jgi:hypothetical protein
MAEARYRQKTQKSEFPFLGHQLGALDLMLKAYYWIQGTMGCLDVSCSLSSEQRDAIPRRLFDESNPFLHVAVVIN